MKFFILIFFIFSGFLIAQTETKVSSAKKILEKYKKDELAHKQLIKKLEVQVNFLDEKLENQLKSTLEFIKKFKDSDQSNNRIIRNKEKMISSLELSIKEYKTRRDIVINEIKFGKRYLSQDLLKIRGWLDGKIILRVKQIVEVTKSLSKYKEYYDRGEDGENFNAKRRVERADREKSGIIRKMRKEIKGYNLKIKAMERELYNIDTKTSCNIICKELAANYLKTELLEQSIEDILSGGKEGASVGRKASLTIDKEIRKRMSDVKSKASTFLSTFDAIMRLLLKKKIIKIKIEKYQDSIKKLEKLRRELTR
jgi:hypothetical protein